MGDEIGEMRLFAMIVEAGGLSAAALRLDLSAAAVSRRLAALEARLGVRLALRHARGFAPTPEGALFYERCHAILAQVDEAEAEAAAHGDRLRGRLRVSAPMELGRRRLAPLLADFSASHPALDCQLLLTDAGAEVVEDDLDLAIRVDPPADQGVIARKLLEGRRVVCAAPAYLARHGMPARPQELLQHACLRLARRHRLLDHWRFRDGEAVREIAVRGALSTSSGEVVHDWALAGRGLALKAEWDIAADLAAGRLVECLRDYWCDSIGLYAVYRAVRPLPLRVRRLVDFLVAALAVTPTA